MDSPNCLLCYLGLAGVDKSDSVCYKKDKTTLTKGESMNHLMACQYCPKDSENGCTMYDDVSWVNRIGGCAHLPERPMPLHMGRVGQQKQKHQDRSYSSKHNRKSKYIQNLKARV
jgi:hypothetical protein